MRLLFEGGYRDSASILGDSEPWIIISLWYYKRNSRRVCLYTIVLRVSHKIIELIPAMSLHANYTITLPAVMARLAPLLCVAVLILAGEGFGEYIIPYLVSINILIPCVLWRGGHSASQLASPLKTSKARKNHREGEEIGDSLVALFVSVTLLILLPL